jgi:hypothetical protein
VLPEKAASFLQNVIREMFEAQADRSGAREFDGVMEWETWIGWDDGYQLTRLALASAPAIWSDSFGAMVRPVVLVAVASDVQPHPPYGARPSVPRFPGQPADDAYTSLDELPATPTGVWARALMQRMNGKDARQLGHGWIGFTLTLPDAPPWVPNDRPTRSSNRS